MKFFIDTANIDEIKEANSMGMADGVTTNPSLIAKEGRDFEEIIKEICEVVDGPISAEVISLDTEGMLKEARHLAAIIAYANVLSHLHGSPLQWFAADPETTAADMAGALNLTEPANAALVDAVIADYQQTDVL